MAFVRSGLLMVITIGAMAQETSDSVPQWVSCFDQAGRFTGPKSVRTSAILSPDGRLRAYAEITAASAGSEACGNTTRLFVSFNGASYTLAFSQSPSMETGTADSLRPIAWSPDGRWLAAEVGYWFYGSDNYSEGLLLYDSRTRATSTPDVLAQIEQVIDSGCSLSLRSLAGFDSRGRVVLKVADLRDGENEGSHCIQGTAEWLLDPATNRVGPVDE